MPNSANRLFSHTGCSSIPTIRFRRCSRLSLAGFVLAMIREFGHKTLLERESARHSQTVRHSPVHSSAQCARTARSAQWARACARAPASALARSGLASGERASDSVCRLHLLSWRAKTERNGEKRRETEKRREREQQNSHQASKREPSQAPKPTKGQASSGRSYLGKQRNSRRPEKPETMIGSSSASRTRSKPT